MALPTDIVCALKEVQRCLWKIAVHMKKSTADVKAHDLDMLIEINTRKKNFVISVDSLAQVLKIYLKDGVIAASDISLIRIDHTVNHDLILHMRAVCDAMSSHKTEMQCRMFVCDAVEKILELSKDSIVMPVQVPNALKPLTDLQEYLSRLPT